MRIRDFPDRRMKLEIGFPTSLCFISDASILQLKSISCKWEKHQKICNFAKKTVKNKAVSRVAGQSDSENAHKQRRKQDCYLTA
jgi:hypothetical protein